MAHKNALLAGNNCQKKSASVTSIKVNDDFLKFVGATPVSGNFLVAKIPENAVIMNAMVVVNKASDAATAATAALGTTEGGAELVAAADIKTVAVSGSLAAKKATGTGQDVYLKLAVTGVATTIGDFDIILEYIEYEKNIGEYTMVS